MDVCFVKIVTHLIVSGVVFSLIVHLAFFAAEKDILYKSMNTFVDL